MTKGIDRINHFEHSVESEFPSWKKGELKRQLLLKILQEDQSTPLEQAAKSIGVSVQQVKRHRRNLIADGLLKVGMLLITFSAGAYYGLDSENDSVDEFIENHVKSPIFEKVEELAWQYDLENYL